MAQVFQPQQRAKHDEQSRVPNEHGMTRARSKPPLFELQNAIGNQGMRRRLQTGLKLSRPQDASEREADRAATAVLQAQAPVTVTEITAAPGPVVQRMCASCEEEEEKERIQRKEVEGRPGK